MTLPPVNSQALACPACRHDKTQVTDSRGSGVSIRRRRECAQCKHRFTTREVVQTAGGDYLLLPIADWEMVLRVVAQVERINQRAAIAKRTALRKGRT